MSELAVARNAVPKIARPAIDSTDEAESSIALLSRCSHRRWLVLPRISLSLSLSLTLSLSLSHSLSLSLSLSGLRWPTRRLVALTVVKGVPFFRKVAHRSSRIVAESRLGYSSLRAR